MVLVFGTIVFLPGRQQIVRELSFLDKACGNLAPCLKKNIPTSEYNYEAVCCQPSSRA
jgi:hypothetical protein